MYVCICNALTDKDISQAAQDGARDVDDAYKMLDSEICCGECYCTAEAVINSTHSTPASAVQHGSKTYLSQAAE